MVLFKHKNKAFAGIGTGCLESEEERKTFRLNSSAVDVGWKDSMHLEILKIHRQEATDTSTVYSFLFRKCVNAVNTGHGIQNK